MSRRLRYMFIATLAAQSPVDCFAIDCRNAIVQVDMDYCNSLENAKLDRRLNSVYRQVMSQVSPESRKRLREEQQAWIKDRNVQCQRTWKDDGAWDKPVWEQISCEAEMTKQRTDTLLKWRSR